MVTNGQVMQANGQTTTLAPALARSASVNAGQNMQTSAQTMMDWGKTIASASP